MTFIKKKLISLTSFVLLTFLFAASAMAFPAFQVKINENIVEFDVSPIIKNGEPLAPIRQVAEAIGAKVEWDAEVKTAWIHKKMMHIEIPIGDTEFYIHRDADFSGIPQTVKVSSPISIISGRTFLPAITLANSLELSAAWDEAAGKLELKTDKNAPGENVVGLVMNAANVKSMTLFDLDQKKLRDCTEAEKNSVIDSFNQAAIDSNFYIQMIAGRVLKASLADGNEVTFTSYGSKTNVVANVKIGETTKTYHLIAPAIAEFLLQAN